MGWLLCMQVRCQDDCRPVVGGALLGLLAGLGVNALVVKMRNLPFFTVGISSCGMALCALAMLCTVAVKMVLCRTDHYMDVAFSLTISLFFVVNAPLLFALWGLGI